MTCPSIRGGLSNTRAFRVAFVAVAIAAQAAVATAAQDLPPIRPGARMRAWMILPDSNVWTGGMILFDHRQLVLYVDSAHPRVQLLLDEIERLEISRGKSEWLTIGMPMLGAALGTALGPLLMQESLQCETGAAPELDCGSDAPKPLIGAAVGAIAFLLLGNLLAEERWVDVELSASDGVRRTVGGTDRAMGQRTSRTAVRVGVRIEW